MAIGTMRFVGRDAETAQIRAIVDHPVAGWATVTGLRGVGKTTLVSKALEGRRRLIHRAPPLPDLAQRARLAESLGRETASSDPYEATDGPPSWRSLFDTAVAVARRARDEPWVLVIDDAHRLREARSRFEGPLGEALAAARRTGVRWHVILVGQASALPDALDPDLGSAGHVELGPIPFREATAFLPGGRPEDLLRAYGLFGGLPSVLSRLDRSAALGTNVRRLLLSELSPLADAGGEWLERDVQSPSRYYAILCALLGGEGDWSTVRAGVPELTTSGQVAPYLKRLSELGLIRVRRSLDASPGSRARRYALGDPFFASWLRYAHRFRPALPDGRGDPYAAFVRPTLDRHLQASFPLVCRQHMRHDAERTLGQQTRVVGSLWGSDYDIPVAGILLSGGAFYGTCLWRPDEAAAAPLARLDQQIRETRYGFGRERRLRIVFSGRSAPNWLQRDVARRHDAIIVGPEALAGGA